MARHASAARATVPERVRSGASTDRAAVASRPRLTVVTRPSPRASSVPFTILCSLIIAGTLLAVLMLNISMSETSYRITHLRAQSQTLTEQQQSLREENERLGTPQELEKKATELGMVPAADPAYIDLSTGKVIGEPQAATGTATAESAPVPVAHIYDEVDTYYGMGNEGN
ncbi:hypothetical protein BRM3_07830 [Brachybacterium huguangmaarense]|uniref:Cell division protein FtsL n=1 Tax=Brachybacterium huguangmaarense TaxID=1652028 RepID=A0ABY6FXA5_9MICO|nr:hypothetical protein [Brachybacterium huguangmaarense]UYG15561.1 hypothetical protein BRM3_07830 [Brachybacterium huguangmaarense]